MKLLIIEDEDDLRNALLRGLKKSGYSADGADNGPDGLSYAETNEYDLIILDLNLPGMDGLEILSKIRETDWNQKILILSARTAYHERVKGLDLGANDYLTKPFDFQELTARIRNLLRREFMQKDSTLTHHGLQMNTLTRQVTAADGSSLSFTPKEYAILEYLLMNKSRPVSAEELIEHAWSEDDSSLFSNAVKVHISLIRKKLAASGPRTTIQVVRGIGYFLSEEVVSK